MAGKGDCVNISETTKEITISRAEYNTLQATIDQQQSEIDALEYRIKTILS